MELWLRAVVIIFIIMFSRAQGEASNETVDVVDVVENARAEALKRYPRNIYFFDGMKANLTFYLLSISHLDETKQTLSFTGNFGFRWKDPFLSLNITEKILKDPFRVLYSSKEIMTPIFIIMNSAFGNVLVHLDERSPVLANTEGKITMNNVIGVETRCDVDITRFPFDEQICKVELFEYIGRFELAVEQATVEKEEEGHTEWEVLSVNASEETPNKNTIVFHLRRRSSSYVVGILFPVVLLSFLNSFVFLLPADSGEKISFLVSIFVTYAVFLNFVNDMIPKSDRMPRLALYLVLVQCHSTLCILATLFILNRHHKQDKKKESNDQKPNEDGQEQIREDDVLEKPIPHRILGDMTCTLWVKRTSHKTVERIMFLVFFSLAGLAAVVFFI